MCALNDCNVAHKRTVDILQTLCVNLKTVRGWLGANFVISGKSNWEGMLRKSEKMRVCGSWEHPRRKEIGVELGDLVVNMCPFWTVRCGSVNFVPT